MSAKPARLWLTVIPGLLLIAMAVLLQSSESTETPNAGGATATYSRGTLRVTLPYDAPHAGPGQLEVDLLNPEDTVLAHMDRHVEVAAGKANWPAELKLEKPLALDDLVWQRLRYRFTYSGSGAPAITGVESISEILRTPVIHIIGQQSYIAGGPAAVRLVVTDSKNAPLTGTLRIALAEIGGKSQQLFEGRLNGHGSAEAQFRFPAGATGQRELRYVADTPIGSAEVTQPVRLEDKVSILLTTEKPLYQPGQTIHVRALALDRANHQAVATRNVTFEVEDSRGNKVFKKPGQTSKFGIASAEFSLAEEVNLGTYHLRALMDGAAGGAANTAEIALNVERYVLPKFKVALDFTGDDRKARHGYRPGDHVTGTVRANYFFGKPVDGGEITVKASGMDLAVFEAGSAQGKTDASGEYRFDFKLPAYFAGRPLSQGATRVLVEATVKDSAGHAESRGEPITVSESPLVVTAIPEGGKVVPGLENQVFVLCSYADGKPAIADLKVHAPGNPDQNVTTDDGGVAIVRLSANARGGSLQVDAADREGNRVSTSAPLETRAGAEQILLRTERAVYKAGDRVAVKVFSTRQRGAVYVDVVKDRQTVLTRDVDLVNGQAELTLTATPELAGTLDLNAYLFGGDAVPVADHRLVFVQPADELKIEATADAPAYKPGDEARVRFRVTNSRGEGVQAALGLQVVDEAVFALAEKQPGFAKVFFYLEQEVMKPRYEIHSIGMPEVVETGAIAQRERAARALFAATEIVNGNRFEKEIGRTVSMTKYPEYLQRYRARFVAEVNRRSAELAPTLINGAQPDFRDGWDNKVKVERASWNPRNTFVMRSAGPDRRFDTPDDLTLYVEVQRRKVIGPPAPGSSQIGVKIEHDRGANNGRAEIAGSVLDATGAAIAGAAITAHDVTTGATRNARSDTNGQFTLAALPSGNYTVQVSANGFQSTTEEFVMAARDRAVLTARLAVGAVSEMVTVTAAEQRIVVGGNVMMAGARMGVVGGVPGGVLGGIIGMPRQFVVADMAAAPAAPLVQREVALSLAKPSTGVPAPRVRSYFPEALFIHPEIITDQHGSATVVIPVADSITTWRMAMMASTARGSLGSGVSALKVFQDFFVDLDLPVTLTQGDRVSLPVAAYNYSGAPGNVALQLKQEDWFTLVDDIPDKSVSVESGRVGGSQFTIEAKRIGKFKLTLSARLGRSHADIVVREIEVVPNGREQNQVFNGRLESSAKHTVNFPATAIPDAGKVFVRLYPGPLSQVIEGMDSLLRMPFGCFEQTSSATYPNVLALDYMKRIKKLTPEVHAKAEGFIANGYQRLLTFEVPGGGFSWFGQAPANKILTGYGLMEFFDMSKVHDVDPRLIRRTQDWLAGQQQADGSWKPDTSFINEGATNRYNTNGLRITAYLGWALENTGYQGPAVQKARQYIGNHMDAKMDAYTLAVLANFAADSKDRDFAAHAMQLLLDARTEKDDQAWWSADETGVYASGESAAVETTGLAVQALLKSGTASATAAKALRYLASKKDASGTWRTTQATIMALRALLLASDKNGSDVRGTVEVTLNDQVVERLVLSADNNDLLHQFVLKGVDSAGPNQVGLRFDGKGGLAYQVVGRYFVPWTEKAAHEPLSINVTYDRTQLAQDDLATATATVRNNLGKAANLVMVDLGIPPGFDLLSEDLQDLQTQTAGRKGGRLEKFSLTATQAILYFDAIPAGETVTVKFRLRAKYPIRARTFRSRVYEYYDPDVSAVARPVQLEVRKRR